jgi:serine/threonine-protein kinase
MRIFMREPSFAFGPFLFDPNSRILRKGDAEIPLPPRVTGVLDVLLRRAGDVVPRQDLIDSVWKDAFVTDTSLAEAVSVLRQALADDPQSPAFIQTMHRRGYRFVAPVELAPRLRTDIDRRPVGAEFDAGSQREEAPAVREAVRPSIARELVPWSAAVIFAVLAAAAVWTAFYRRGTPEPAVTRFAVSPAAGTSFDGRAPALAISPDAAVLAWSACDPEVCRLFIRPVNRVEPAALAGTEGAAAPFFSPDGGWLAFFADGRLKKVALSGGAPVVLAEAPDALGGVWTRGGEIVFAGSPFGGLMRISQNGGAARPLTTPDEAAGEIRHAWPALTPSGSTLFFTSVTDGGAGARGRLSVMRMDGTTGWKTLLDGIGMARAMADGALVVARGRELHAVRFDSQRAALAGATQVLPFTAALAGGGAQFAAGGGAIAVAAPAADAPDLAWLTATGEPILVPAGRQLRMPALSPDGARIAGFDADDPARPDIWITDLERGASTRITHEGVNVSPVWSVGSDRVFYASRTAGPFELWSRDADAATPPSRLRPSSRNAFPGSASRDALAFVQTAVATRADIWLLPLNGGAPRPVVATPFDDVAPSFSPNGALIAYQSNEPGRWEVYVVRASDGRRAVVSSSGGAGPQWTHDGSRIVYRAGGRLMQARVSDGTPDLRIGSPETLAGAVDGSAIGIDPSGRVLLQRQPRAAGEALITLNWTRELLQLLGPPAAALPR